ncbi:organic cation transporter protein [Aplysia californica]|uniref:Organic cation transporter protein n=1 Tax=Aplysia californica TaxID=6500 RepID=A0ABM0JC83_APLCA|nr:organic cation transporter protein [Aplysia californica]
MFSESSAEAEAELLSKDLTKGGVQTRDHVFTLADMPKYSADNSDDVVNSADEVDQLQQQLGGYGRYQILIYVLIGLVYMRGGWHVWIPGLQAYDPGYHCAATPGLHLNESVPGKMEKGVWEWDTCKQYTNYSVNNHTEPCTNGWVYLFEDPDTTSIVSDFDLVCDRDYLVTLTSTIYMVGTTCSVIFLTPLSDRFGTKRVMLVCLWLQAIVGTALVWSGNIIVYSVFKFFIGLFNMTIALCAYVLMTETFDAAHREPPTIFMQFFWAMGIMSLALFGYLLPDWGHLELVIALPINLLSFFYIWLIPDSLPWLLSKGRTGKAKDVILRFLRVNNLPDIPLLDKTLDKFRKQKDEFDIKNTGGQKAPVSADESQSITGENGGDGRLYTMLDLFKTPRMRINSLLMFYLFLVNALAYIGIMYTSPDLNGNRFLNLFLLGVVEVPAYITCFFANRFIGRRKTICGFLFVCGVANIAALLLPATAGDGSSLEWLQITLVMIGKFAVTGSYSTIYLYAAEVFPTVIRNQAIGASSFFENIGSVAAPSMVLVNDQVNHLPLGIFGGMTVVGAALVLLLPETHNRPLPHTIEEVEQNGANKAER